MNVQLREAQAAATALDDYIIDHVPIGKDILELLSSSMYVDPLTIYREYLQNAADAYDELGAQDQDRRVDIFLDAAFRTIRIRDYGGGISNAEFVRRLISFGASRKRGTSARGFRGVGRLAGLGYCRELVFRSRSSQSEAVRELSWDCRKLQLLLRDASYKSDLATLVREVVNHREIPNSDAPPHFFEVELRGVVRLKSDRLLSEPAVVAYIEQVAPLPFHPEFSFGERIRDELRRNVDLGELSVFLNGAESPIYRPYRDEVDLGAGGLDSIRDVEIVQIPSDDGSITAVGWIGHHSYSGALSGSPKVRGLRARVGNVQLGESALFDELFPEQRFNSWTIGEIHVLDRRIQPNGRRDNFEQNAFLTHLQTRLTPIAREIGRLCRVSSVERKIIRQFESLDASLEERFSILEQGGLTLERASDLYDEVKSDVADLARITRSAILSGATRENLKSRLSATAERLNRIPVDRNDSLVTLSPARQAFYREAIDLIYECSANRVAARALVERILEKSRRE
jgi:Histidine kinase-, DNA gyrase B-, and HSP90-like ATPase